jgi:P4 family phage/plasmid primase-like protien
MLVQECSPGERVAELEKTNAVLSEIFEPRYMRIKPYGKNPIEPNWTDITKQYKYEEIRQYILKGENYGVMARDGLIEVDIDTPELKDRMKKTFTVESGSGRGAHYYYKCKDIKTNAALEELNDKGEIIKSYGQIQVWHRFLVAAGSIHPDTKKLYRVIDNTSIVEISLSELTSIFGDLLILNTKDFIKQAEIFSYDNKIKIDKIIDITNFKRNGEEYIGENPLHGSSKNGRNLYVNPQKNIWSCFHDGHNSGGSPITWLAVQYGLIRCQDCHKGAITPSIFEKTMQIAQEKGLVTEKEALQLEANHGDYNPIRLAKYLLKKYYFALEANNDNLLMYDPETGLYANNADIIIRSEICDILDEDTKAHHHTDVVYYIKGEVPKERRQLKENPNLIAMLNGYINVVTGERKDFSPEVFLTVKIPVTYNLTQQYNKKFMIDVVGEEQIPVLQEYLGYTLYRGMPFHSAIMFFGSGKNGKSTLIKLIETFIGKENCAHVTLQSLCEDRFSSAQLYHKLINTCGDLSPDELKNTDMFKRTTGDDVIHAQNKFKDPFDFDNYCKQIYSANELPKTKDQTFAYWRRWQLIACGSVFDGSKCVPNIIKQLTTPEELSGLLNFALEGLNRLLLNLTFSPNSIVENIEKTWIKGSDPAKAFIKEMLQQESDPQKIILVEEMSRVFLIYCAKNSIAAVSQKKLTQSIGENATYTSQTQRRLKIEGKSERKNVWQNVSFIPEKINEMEIILRENKQEEDSDSKTKQTTISDVTDVTPVTASPIKRGLEGEGIGERKEEGCRKPIEGKCRDSGDRGDVYVRTGKEMCGECGKFHLESCGHPMCAQGGDPKLIKADSNWAGTCNDFIKKQAEMSNPGENM